VTERLISFNQTAADPLFGLISDIFCAESPRYYFGRQNKTSTTSSRANTNQPMVVQVSTRVAAMGVIFVECLMSPRIGVDIESVLGVKTINRNPSTKSVEPLVDAEVISLMEMITTQRNSFKIPKNCIGIELYEYVIILRGPHKGEYGIVKELNARRNMFQIALRHDGKTIDTVYVDLEDVVPLKDPPEIHYKVTTHPIELCWLLN
jgi:transcription antitermination factor NusG